MQKNQFSFKKSIWLILPLAFAAFYLVSISSCKGKNGGKKESTASGKSCMKLTKEQIQEWIKKGYTDSAKPDYMSSLRFKTAYAFPGSVFKVYVIGVRKNGTVIDESLTELTPVDTCNKTHIDLSDYIFTGTNPIELSDLKILKKDGKMIDSLQYLQLEPYTWRDSKTHFNFLAFTTKVVGSSGAVLYFINKPLPCPPCPNCPNPCPPPDGCISPCSSISQDSL